MRNRVFQSVCIVNLLLLFPIAGLAQVENEKPSFINTFGTLFSNMKPIVFGTSSDGLPDLIKVVGRIEEANPYRAHCGVIATAGTLKIRLENKSPGYPHDFAYVVISCFAVEDPEKLKGGRVAFEARKLHKFPYDSSVSIGNFIDSNGVPFYLAKVDAVGGLLKKVGKQ